VKGLFMTSNFRIATGVICGVFLVFAIFYGFNLKSKVEAEQSIAVTFDRNYIQKKTDSIDRIFANYHRNIQAIIKEFDEEGRRIREDFTARNKDMKVYSISYCEKNKNLSIRTYWKLNDEFKSMTSEIEKTLGDIAIFNTNPDFTNEYQLYIAKKETLVSSIYSHLESTVRDAAVGKATTLYGNFRLRIPDILSD
jgi:hypothetical protein